METTGKTLNANKMMSATPFLESKRHLKSLERQKLCVGTYQCPSVGDIILVNQRKVSREYAGKPPRENLSYNFIGKVINVYTYTISIQNLLALSQPRQGVSQMNNSVITFQKTEISSGYIRYIKLSSIDSIDFENIQQDELEIADFMKTFNDCCSNLYRYMEQQDKDI